MTSIWVQTPAYKINDFITHSLRNEEIIPEEDDYITELSGISGDTPLGFIPSQQSPEITTPYDGTSPEGFVDLPFGTYTITTQGYLDRTYLNCGQISYIFYTADIEKLIEINNYIIDLCKREEYSAADINDFLEQDESNPFDFKSISIESSVGPIEAETAGGRHSYLIVVTYDCTYDLISIADNSLGPFSGKQNMWH